MRSFATRRLRLETDSPQPVTLDGELLGSVPATIEQAVNLGFWLVPMLAADDKAFVKGSAPGQLTSSASAVTAVGQRMARFLQQDAVLCWDIPDYLAEPLVKPMVERIASVLNPKGYLLAFFHTKDAGPDAPYYRYHINGLDNLRLQRGPQFRLQRVFNNRHIENLFHDYASLKFFLARDNVREVLVVR